MGDVKPFLTQCNLNLELQAATFTVDQAKITIYLSLSPSVRQRKSWATVDLCCRSVIWSSLVSFTKAFDQIFHHSDLGHVGAQTLIMFKKVKCEVSDYTIKCHSLAAKSDWNAKALANALLQGLCDTIKTASSLWIS